MDFTGALPAIGMLPSSLDGNIPICVASEAHLCRRKQFVDAASVKADDDLVADDDRRSAATLVGPNQLLKRRGVHRDIAFDKGDPFLRKILFRAMAGASTIGGIDFHTLFAHRGSPPLRGCVVAVISVPRRPIHGFLIEAWHEMPINVNHDLDRVMAARLFLLTTDGREVCPRFAAEVRGQGGGVTQDCKICIDPFDASS
jgi:hypothetical protein